MVIVATNGSSLAIQTPDGWNLYKESKVTKKIDKDDNPKWLVSAVTGKGYVRVPELDYPTEELTIELADELYERYSK